MGGCCIVWLEMWLLHFWKDIKNLCRKHRRGAAAGYVIRSKHGCGTCGKAALHGVPTGKSRCIFALCTSLVNCAPHPHPHPSLHTRPSSASPQDEVRSRHGAAQGPGAGGAGGRRGLWRRGNRHQGPRLQERAPVKRRPPQLEWVGMRKEHVPVSLQERAPARRRLLWRAALLRMFQAPIPIRQQLGFPTAVPLRDCTPAWQPLSVCIPCLACCAVRCLLVPSFVCVFACQA